MKRYSKLFYALALIPFLALSCQEEELKYEAGEEDNADCYGVYFPKQEGLGAVELDPVDPTQKVIKVSRKKSEGEITVPIDIITNDPKDFWTVTELKFEEGQEDTTIVLSFDQAEVGKAGYSVTLQISDPRYASKYSSNPTFVTFSPQRVKWNDVKDAEGKNLAKYTESCVVGIFGVPAITWDVEVQERDDQPGVYRLIEPYKNYNELLSAKLGEDAEIEYFKKANIIIDASDPEAVWVPTQSLGIDLGYGDMRIGSVYALRLEQGYSHEEAIAKGAAPAGKMVNGVITFPADEIGIWMPDYDDITNGWWSTKWTKFVLPGGVETDYSLEIEAGEPDAGKIDLTFVPGVDIDTVLFAAFTNTMKTAEIGDAAAAIRMRSIPIDTLDLYGKADSTITLQFDTTGVFTVVAVGYDTAGVAQTTASVEFGYLKDGDVNPVILYADIFNKPGIVTDSSSLAFSFIGKDITKLQYAVFNKATFDADPQAALDKVMEKGNEFDADELKLVNSTGYTGKVKRLIPGTDFVLVWWAFNGYVSAAGAAGPATTSGDALPIYLDYSFADLDATKLLANADDWCGTYNLYAFETYTNKSGIREYLGKVTVAKGEMPDTTGLYKAEEVTFDGTEDWWDVTGLLAPSVDYAGHMDSLKFFNYSGMPSWFDTCESIYQPAEDEEGYNAVAMTWSTSNGGFYTWCGGSFFIPIADGYWFFVSHPYWEANGYTLNGIATTICDETWNALEPGMKMTDILLVKVEKDDNGVAKDFVMPKRPIAFDSQMRKVTSRNVNYVDAKPVIASPAPAKTKTVKAYTQSEKVAFEMPNRPIKMTVSAPAKAAPAKQLSPLKGGKIRKQDVRGR